VLKHLFQLPEHINASTFKRKALHWASSFERTAYYDNNEYNSNKYSRYESLIAAGAEQVLELNAGEDAFGNLENFLKENSEKWTFGYLGYDLKNELENLNSANLGELGASDLSFFVPQHLVILNKDCLTIEIKSKYPKKIWAEILLTEAVAESVPEKLGEIKQRINKEDYLKTVKCLKQHIIEGDIYELNFCQEFYCENAELNPVKLFARLNRLSPTPFSAYYRSKNQHVLCASPERFLYKSGAKVVSQPIKGTIRRAEDIIEDEKLKSILLNSEKDRAENVMIVDLVRNDLARCAEIGSVSVEELFGVYPFRQVWQMISTISGKLDKKNDGLSTIKAAFPPGSMTGAPKIISMQLIEQYEQSRRGVYSGVLGYFSPDGDFDFNVVIRSMFYNSENKYLSFQTGGAIVYDSDPEKEYEECLLKAKGMRLALNVEY
jgi:para-aminobenzoate synthetase component 1